MFIPGIIRGLGKGLIDQVADILSLVIGAWMAFKFSSLLTAILMPYFTISEGLLGVISFIIILVAVCLILRFIGNLIEKLLKAISLGWADKILGFALAILTNALIIGLFIILFNTINTKFNLVKEETLSLSLLYTPLKNLAYLVFPYLKQLLMKQ